MGKFIDQTLYVAESVRVVHPWKLFDTPWEGAPTDWEPLVKLDVQGSRLYHWKCFKWNVWYTVAC